MSNTALRIMRVDWHGQFAIVWLPDGTPASAANAEQLWRIIRSGKPLSDKQADKLGKVETTEEYLARGGKVTPGTFPKSPFHNPRVTLEALGLVKREPTP